MGARKRIKANAMKEARKNIAFAKLNNCPTSPRKMRLIADLIRGMDADKALAHVNMSGFKSNVSEPHILPVLPNPQITSSAIKRTSYFSSKACTLWK